MIIITMIIRNNLWHSEQQKLKKQRIKKKNTCGFRNQKIAQLFLIYQILAVQMADYVEVWIFSKLSQLSRNLLEY